MDIDDKVRITAAVVFSEVAAAHPALSTPALLEPLLGRLRDRKVAVRREVAAQVCGIQGLQAQRCLQLTLSEVPGCRVLYCSLRPAGDEYKSAMWYARQVRRHVITFS